MPQIGILSNRDRTTRYQKVHSGRTKIRNCIYPRRPVCLHRCVTLQPIASAPASCAFNASWTSRVPYTVVDHAGEVSEKAQIMSMDFSSSVNQIYFCVVLDDSFGQVLALRKQIDSIQRIN